MTSVLSAILNRTKTFVALDLGLSVATGRRCLGADVGHSGPVVYIAADGTSLKQRVHAWKAAHGYRDDEPLGLFIWPEAVNFLNPHDVDRFIQFIISLSPKLVIGDTLARCIAGGDENLARDMGLLVEHTDRVKRPHKWAAGALRSLILSCAGGESLLRYEVGTVQIALSRTGP